MKKLLLAVLGLSVLVVPACAENKIQMVTYFPVPYVAYSKVTVDKQLDVGLTASACQMNLGCSDLSDYGTQKPLYVSDNMIVQRGTAQFNSGIIRANRILMGKQTSSSAANLNFSSNLRIGELLNGYTLEATNMNVTELKLFPDYITNSFPSCSAASGGSPNISWQELTLYKTAEVYLVCG